MTMPEKRQLLKKVTADHFGQYNQDGLAELLALTKANLKNRRMGLYLGMNVETLFVTDLANRLDQEKMHIEKTTHYARQKLILSVAGLIGITYDQDGLPVSDGEPLKDGVKAMVYNYLRDHKDDVKTLLGVTVKHHDTMQGIATTLCANRDRA